MPPTAPKSGPLTGAATALETDLRAFEEAVADTAKVRLDTRKNLERAARELERAAAIYTRMQTRLSELASRLQAGHDRAMENGQSLHTLALDLKARQEIFVAELASQEALMQEAAALRDLAEQGPDALAEIQAGLVALAGRAKERADAARAIGFRDLAEEATGRAQQLTALANKLGAN